MCKAKTFRVILVRIKYFFSISRISIVLSSVNLIVQPNNIFAPFSDPKVRFMSGIFQNILWGGGNT